MYIFKFVLVVLLLLVFLFALRIYLLPHAIQIPRDSPVLLQAKISEEPKITDTNQIIHVADTRVYADLYPRYRVGDKIRIEGSVDSVGRMFQPQIEKIGESSFPGSGLSKFRFSIEERVNRMISGNEAALVNGMILGEDIASKSLRDKLINTGTIHVVVVSGQNLAIIAALFISFSSYLGRRLALLLAVVAVFCYAALAGFNAPVIRASLMVLFSSLATFLGRQYSALWGLGLASVVILFIWPHAISEISFQLTFAATLGIILAGFSTGPVTSFVEMGPAVRHPRPTSSLQSNFNIKSRMSSAAAGARRGTPTDVTHFNLSKMILGVFGNNIAIALSAYLFTAPIILFYFGRVSLLSPIVNVFVAELVGPITILGFLVAFSGFIYEPIAQVFAYLAFGGSWLFLKIVDVFSGFSIGQMDFGKGNWVLVVGIYAGIFAGMWVLRRKYVL